MPSFEHRQLSMNTTNMPARRDKLQAGATSLASTPVQPLPDFRECTKWPAGLVRCVANSGHGHRIKRQRHSSNKSSRTRRQRKLYSRSNKGGFAASVTTCLVIACWAHAAAHIIEKQMATCYVRLLNCGMNWRLFLTEVAAWCMCKCTYEDASINATARTLNKRKKKNDEQG